MNYFLKYVVLLANNLTASGIIMQYWLPGINVAVWVVSFAVPIILINVWHSPTTKIQSHLTVCASSLPL